MKRPKLRLRPTSLWILFGPILICMWMAAINYSNNLIYAILYLIGSLTFISIFYTWRNLSALELEHFRVHSAFAGGEVRLEIHLRNPTRQAVYGLFFSRLDEGGLLRRYLPLALPGGGVLRIDAGDTRAVDLYFPAGIRGRYRVTSLQIRSAYPFGLFTAGIRFPFRAEYFVYPRPQGTHVLPELESGGAAGLPIRVSSGDDFAGVRAYSQGESLRHVDWKAYARGRPLSVKQFAGGESQELWFDADNLADLELEDRLSQLALWVVTAEKDDVPYALRLSGALVPLGHGADHARRVLEILAINRSPGGVNK